MSFVKDNQLMWNGGKLPINQQIFWKYYNKQILMKTSILFMYVYINK